MQNHKVGTLIANLKECAGSSHVLTSERETERYRKGFRSGEGEAVAVVLPQTLVAFWRVLQVCVDADAIVITQAANTGLTEGSTPKGTYDRDVVIISTLAISGVNLIKGGEQVVALAGSTLFTLEKMLKPLGRTPHSVIGSTSIGASIVGGVCNNSGGALARRGPAYTELALYAQRNADGTLELVNNLGIDLGDDPETILNTLEQGNYSPEMIHDLDKHASDPSYGTRIRDIDADSPSRYNANPDLLHSVSGCAGKLIVFAVRLDTFPAEKDTKVFYVGTNDTQQLTQLRRALLSKLNDLPILAEYLHRDMFNIAETHGKDTFLLIKWLGTDRLPQLFKAKGWVDALAKRLPLIPDALTDLFMQGFFKLFPNHLPQRLRDYRDRFEHHLIVKVEHDQVKEVEALLQTQLQESDTDYFLCTDDEGKKAFLHRFAAAGAAVRYAAVNPSSVGDVIALDIALRRNDEHWMEELPPEIENRIESKLYYGHFLCHVFHQDYIITKGVDSRALKADMLALLDKRRAQYPAEHNVGHLYKASDEMCEFYQSLDPTNTFNPGIGKTSRLKNWASASE